MIVEEQTIDNDDYETSKQNSNGVPYPPNVCSKYLIELYQILKLEKNPIK